MANLPKLRLVDADEDYTVPIDANEKTPREKAEIREKKIAADGIKEGRRRELAKLLKQLGLQSIQDAGAIPKLRIVHEEQLELVRATVGAKSLYKGLAIGLAFSVFTASMGLLGGYALFERGVTTQVAAQRVPRASAPVLQYEASESDYQHDRREPGDAP